MANFALIGASGYVAPRHMKAIKETGNNLVAVFDPNDSVGILDSYFPEADFFTEFERFDRHIDKKRRKGDKIDYVSICSPNYLHDAHVRFALRIGANVICEKPLVLNPWNIDALRTIEEETNCFVNTILQLRLHPSIIKLKKEIQLYNKNTKVYDIKLKYVTPRGHWYDSSWKGDIKKSGGVITNIGVHFFDILTWIFGNVSNSILYKSESHKAEGFLQLEKANIEWFLSIDKNDLPEGYKIYKSVKIDNKDLELSDHFDHLHTLSYKEILKGRGFNLNDVKKAIEIVSDLRYKNIHNKSCPTLMNEKLYLSY